MTTKETREVLYGAILAEAEQGLRRYYEEFPERLSDARSAAAVEWSQRGVHRILKLLDGYDFRKKGDTK